MAKLSSIAYYVTDKISSNDISLAEYVTTDCILQNKKGREVATNLPPQPCSLIRYQRGDVLIANIRPYLKKVWFADIDGGASPDVLVFRAKDGHSPSFLYAILLQDSFFDYVMQGTKGSKMPRGDKEQILRYEMPTFSCSEESIGTFFLNLDRKIHLNERINQNLEAMAKQLYDYWFVQFDFPNEDGEPYKSSGGEMIWNESLKREIPKGWITTTINGVCTSCRGVSYGKDDLLPNGNGVLVFRGNNIENNHIVYDSNVAFVPYDFINEEQRIKEGDIVMTMSSGSKAHVGKCAMFYKDSEHTFGAFLSKFTPKKEMRYMIFLFLTSEYFKSLITAFCNGTGINNLTNQTFDDVILVLPNENTLQQFESKVKPLFDIIGNNEENIEILTKQRNELLPLLMNGQVSINSDLAVSYIIYGLKYQNYEREHHSGDSCENAA